MPEGDAPVVGVLGRIHNQTLSLKGYSLNESLCLAIGEACRRYPELFESLIIENNGLKDKALAALLDGLTGLTVLKRFICTNNELQGNSMRFLR